MEEPGKEVDYSPCGQGHVRNGLAAMGARRATRPQKESLEGEGGGRGELPIGLVRGQVSSIGQTGCGARCEGSGAEAGEVGQRAGLWREARSLTLSEHWGEGGATDDEAGIRYDQLEILVMRVTIGTYGTLRKSQTPCSEVLPGRVLK